jgi:chromosomal replication initiator protein
MADAVIAIPIPGQNQLLPCGNSERLGTALPGQGFLAGPENRLAEVAVRWILRGPPNGWNPMILYGPNGSGKSHLALGLAAAWKEKHRRQRVECTTAMEFARELAEAIEAQGVEEFREKYRHAALVVIEDVDCLGHKGVSHRRPERLSAQEELIHTLDALIQRGAWVLLTSAIAPGECSGILPMLQSRWMGGLIVPLALPGFSTRLTLIQQHTTRWKCGLSESAAETLAERLQGTVAEIRQAMARLQNPPGEAGKPIGAKAAKQLLDGRGPGGEPSLREIAALTAKHFGLKTTALRGPSRHRNIVMARDLAISLSRQLLGCSLEEIGRFFGGRDHTTVMHSCRKIKALAKSDAALRRELELLKIKVCKPSQENVNKVSNPC